MAQFFWKYHQTFVGLLVIFFGLLAPYSLHVTPDNSVEAMSLNDDSTMALIKKYADTFGSEEFISIAFKTDDILSPQTLRLVQKISQNLSNSPHVERVMSLTSLWRFVESREAADVNVKVMPYIAADWYQQGVPQKYRENLLNNPVYLDLIYNQKGTHTAVIAQLKPLGRQDELRQELIDQTRALTKQLTQETGLKFYVSGYPVHSRAIYEAVEREQYTLTPLMLLAVFFIMYCLYRRVSLALIVVGLIVFVLVLVLGVLGIFDVHLNWLTSVVPAVILIVSVCDAMHVINTFQNTTHITTGLEKTKIVFQRLGGPCLLTSLTTAIGFGSLYLSKARPMQEFGLYVALGVLVAFILSFTLLVVILVYVFDTTDAVSIKKQSVMVTKILDLSYLVVSKYARLILICSGLMITVSVVALFFIETRQDNFLFKTDHYELAAANEFSAQGAGGGSEIYAVFTATEGYAFYQPKYLKMIEAMQTRALKEIGSLTKVLSVVDVIKYINQAYHGDDSAYYKIPATSAEVAQLLFMLEFARDTMDLSTLINEDYSQTRVRLFAQIPDNDLETTQMFSLGEKIIKEGILPGVKAELTGRPKVMVNVLAYLPQIILQSGLLSVVIIMIVLMIYFRSVYLGAIAMIPNIIPIVLGMGFMGALDLQLNLATSMVFTIALGIAVDDSIHMIWCFRANVFLGLGDLAAYKKTLNEVGPPIVISTVVLMGGFLMLCFSSIWPTTYLGVLVALCCVLALLADLTLTPVLLIRFKAFGKDLP